MDILNISIIGAGRVGSTMAYLFKGKKNNIVKIKTISSRSQQSLNKVKDLLGSGRQDINYTLDNTEAARDTDCLFIATPDDLIKKVCGEIFSEISDYRGRYVIHFSGSKKLEALAPAKEAGASVGCMHPIKSFASVEQAIATMEKTVFGLTYSDNRAEKLLQHLVENLKGSFIKVEDSKKPLYHAACCVASNYLVALFDYAADLALKIGIENRQAVDALMGLAEGTLKNIGRMGTQKSLTGPIARGDKGTVAEHLKNLKKHGCNEDIYRVMGKKAAEIALENKWLEPETYKILISIMEDETRQ